MKPPNSLSNEKLIAYSEIVAREVDMLRWSASMLHQFWLAQRNKQTIKNDIADVTDDVFLEVFGMHARNLIDFLYLRNHFRKDRSTDVVIEDYVAPAQISSHLPPITWLLDDTKIKADKRIAHLTLSRLDEGMFARGWQYTEIYRHIMEAFNRIAPAVSATNTSEHFRVTITPPYPPFYQVILSENEDPVRQLRGIITSIQLPKY